MKVVEVIISPGDDRPYMAQDADGRWIAYIRQGDQNLTASSIMLKIWERQRSGGVTTIHFGKAEGALLTHLESHPYITIPQFRRLAGLSKFKAEGILVDFIMLGLLRIEHSEAHARFSLAPGYQDIIEGMA